MRGRCGRSVVGVFVLLGMFSLACAGCGTLNTTAAPAQSSQRAATSEYNALVSHLRSAGSTVTPGGSVRQAFLSVPGQVLVVDGEHVEVYQYADAATVAHDSTRISKDACLIKTAKGSTMVEWPHPPHLYKKDHLIVIYIGDNPALINEFVSMYGPQFAGE